MKKTILIALVFLLILIAIVSFGCNKKNIVVKGEGVEITKEDIDKRIKEIEETQQLDNLPKEIVDQIREQIKQQAIENLVREQLLFSGIKKEGIEVTNKEINEGLDQYKKMFSTEEEFKEQLKSQNQTEASLKEALRRQLLIEKIKEKLTKDKIKITDTDIKKYYEDNKQDFMIQEQVRVRHIVVDKLEKAKDILAELKKDGNFESLVQKHSIDELTKSGNGEIGWFPRGMIFSNTPKFDEAVFKLKVNELTEPIKTDLGYHIVQLLEKKAAEQRPLVESKQIIKTALETQKEQELMEEWFKKLEKEANIKYEEEEKQPAPEPEKK